ncbi:hypothetical protein SAMN05192542_11230 [Paraburkholderia caballeronis]|uniref:Uncharacterized protein n=1 Tax=Paraburkholderia caballeronis TaxID=416943 RepID=A0A1H7SH86_9BURK|nr:hypothetical protein C7403_11530 [Paraburkholderia caballeronis]PXW95965.1 hypothetical protein C7407_11530 [Paraburkholderia caballeronis]RAJ92331.1 hypothetical protein C7409_11530 [Paraburkholderia caballeronis]SEL71853.1 hypothetical protein SAMN05192542_11230 [Paraburkholderia caballeronis]
MMQLELSYVVTSSALGSATSSLPRWQCQSASRTAPRSWGPGDSQPYSLLTRTRLNVASYGA